MIKLYCSDLDGTLLVDGKIDKRTVDGISKLRENGIDIILASGRAYPSIKYLADQAGIKPYIVANNGALSVDLNGNNLYVNPIKFSSLKFLIDYAEKKGIYYHLYDKNSLYSSCFNDERIRHLEIEETKAGRSFQMNIIILKDVYDFIYRNNVGALKIQYAIDPKYHAKIIEDISPVADINITKSGDIFIEMMSNEVTKWQTIEMLGKSLGVDKSEIACIGDYLNDYEMISKSGFGIAMGNALEEVKLASDYVTDSCEDHGNLKAMEYILEMNKNV